jgi:hypothetical protein
MGMFTEWRDDAYATLQAKYAELEADYKRLLEGDDWVAQCIRLENLHKDLVDEHRVTEEQLAERDKLIEQMRDALSNADGLIDEYAADYEHRDNVDEIRDEIKAALSAAERIKP